jgi:phosphotransferase system enzyme I (PtsI)
LQNQLIAHFQKLEKAGDLKAETIDGYQVMLSANIEMIEEIEMLHQYGGNGVGLLRSEYMFATRESFPNEEEQFDVYSLIIEKMQGLPIVIRVFDLGGDKSIAGHPIPDEGEENPFLGCRAIRFLLKERAIFKTQLRAILRASVKGNVSIMFPMISGLDELLQAKVIVREAYEELEKEGVELKGFPRIGCMIEVPSAALVCDVLARESDFLSIGTNDLVQYALAVDRGNQSVNELYNPAHPAILRLIKLMICEANRHGIPVTICGEIAADPRFTPLLLGLGVRELSVSARYIPIIKNAVRNNYILSASHLVEKALTLSSASEIQELLNQEYLRAVPDDFFYNF